MAEYLIIKTSKIIEKINDGTIQYLDNQRSIDQSHVDTIIDTQKEYYSKNTCYLFTNSIVFGSYKENWYILDGQHRIECIKILNIDQKIPVTKIKVKSLDELNTMLVLINSNKPYVQISTPDVKTVEKYLVRRYKKYIKGSRKPNRPHFNINNVVRKLNVHVPFSAKKFIRELEIYNNNIYTSGSDKDIERCTKAGVVPFYAGLKKNAAWVDEVMKFAKEDVILISVKE